MPSTIVLALGLILIPAAFIRVPVYARRSSPLDARNVKVILDHAKKICGTKHTYRLSIENPPSVRYCCKCRDPLVWKADCAFGLPATTSCVCPAQTNNAVDEKTSNNTEEVAPQVNRTSESNAKKNETTFPNASVVSTTSDDNLTRQSESPSEPFLEDACKPTEIKPESTDGFAPKEACQCSNDWTINVPQFFVSIAAAFIGSSLSLAGCWVVKKIHSCRQTADPEAKPDSPELSEVVADSSVNLLPGNQRTGAPDKKKKRRKSTHKK